MELPRLQRQPSEWTCLPTALAMLLGQSVDNVIRKYVHDGSAEVPGNPFNRLCITDLETVRVAFDMGVYLVPIWPYFRISEHGVECWKDDPTFKRILESHSGLIVGNWHGGERGHALCWLHATRSALDPRIPEEVGHLNERFNVEVFYAWVNRPQEF